MTTANLVIQVSQKGVKEADRALGDLTQESKRAEAGVKALNNEAVNSQGSFRNFNGVIGQAGYQINDFVVQVQSGQSALIALSQQGSQLIGAISPIGGALFAIGTVAASMLVPSLLDGSDKADLLTKSLEELDAVIVRTDDGVLVLSDQVRELAKISEQAAQNFIALGQSKAIGAIEEASKKVVALGGDFASSAKDIEQYREFLEKVNGTQTSFDEALGRFSRTFNQSFKFQQDALKALQKEYGLTDIQLSALLQSFAEIGEKPTAKQLEGVAAALSKVSAEGEFSNAKLRELANAVNEASLKATEADSKYNALTGALEDTAGALDELNEKTVEHQSRMAGLIQALQVQAATIHMTASEAALYRLEMEGASLEEVTAAKAALDTIDTYNAKQEAIEAATRAQAAASRESARAAEAAKRQAEQEQRLFERQQQQAAAYLEQIRRVNLSETELINQRYADRIAKLNEFYDLEAITIEQREAGRRDAEIARQKEFGAIRQRELDQQIEREKEANEEKRRQQERLFDSSVSLLTLFGKEQSKAAKVALLTAQIYAQKDLIISQSKAVGKAFADGGLIGGLAALPAVLAQFAPLLATVASARAQGGTLSNGQVTRMNEREPELFAPNSNGMVFTGKMMQNMMNNAVQGNGGGARITVINNAAGVQHSVEQNGDEIRIVAERVFNERIDGGVSSVLSDPRSKSSRALTTNYNAARKL